MRTHNIAAIPADGIGPEVIEAGAEVLAALARRNGNVDYKLTFFDWGSDYYKKHGVMMPADGLDQLKPFDAIYFGAVGAPDVPDHITLWGLRLPICQGFDQYANVRPTKIFPASHRLCAMSVSAISTGSSCARIRKANIPAMAAVPTGDFPKRSAPKWRSSPASA
jgi:isocitrate/isopropylmalate dehydrogenase